MKKKLLSIQLIVTLFLSGCAVNKDVSDFGVSTEAVMENPIATNVVEEDAETVDIILSMVGTDTSVAEYVEKLNKENPDSNYVVYDDSHYMYTISKDERKKILEELCAGEAIQDYFTEAFSKDGFGGAFLSVETNDDFTLFEFYVDKEKYDSAGFIAYLEPLLVAGLLGDIVQAYNLIPPEERHTSVRIINSENNEVIYDSEKE